MQLDASTEKQTPFGSLWQSFNTQRKQNLITTQKEASPLKMKIHTKGSFTTQMKKQT
jgi:hypothetical protein